MNKTYSSNKRWDQRYSSLSTSDCLTEAKEKSKIAVNSIISFELASSLDSFPGRCDFDKDAILFDANWFV